MYSNITLTITMVLLVLIIKKLIEIVLYKLQTLYASYLSIISSKREYSLFNIVTTYKTA